MHRVAPQWPNLAPSLRARTSQKGGKRASRGATIKVRIRCNAEVLRQVNIEHSLWPVESPVAGSTIRFTAGCSGRWVLARGLNRLRR